MILLITIVTRDVGVFLLRSGISEAGAGGQGLFFLLSCLIPPIFPEPPLLVLLVFLVFLILLQGLRRVDIDRLYFLGLGFFRAGRVFGSCFLGLHLQGGAVRKAVTLETADIRVSDHGARS